jgi:hypothetical protein
MIRPIVECDLMISDGRNVGVIKTGQADVRLPGDRLRVYSSTTNTADFTTCSELSRFTFPFINAPYLSASQNE